MKNNPFVIFVTAFLVVMGSGFAIAAIGGSGAIGGGVDESAFAVDFGGEIATATDSTSGVTAVAPARDVQSQRDVGGGLGLDHDEKVPDPDETEIKKEVAKEDDVTGGPSEVEGHADESTWIEVLAPTDGQVFDDEKVVFEGAAEPGAEVYAGEYRADIDADGGWRIVLFLSKGSQTVQFKAIDADGNHATDSVTVGLKAIDEPATVEFTVHQKYVESHEPFEKFFGTGTPGVGITASSEYGSADVRVGEHGEWWLPIEFSGLTESTTFPITVSTTEGFSGTYSFSYTAKVHEFTVHQKYVESHEAFEKFFGTGTPGMGITASSEYGTEDARVGENGEWYLPIEFAGLSGTATFPITISTTQGFSGIYWFTYVSKVHEFTANQKYGSCSENPPYDVFWGTGEPGSVVEIDSAFGNARLEVGEGGWWEKKVFFESAPVGATFEVVVTDSLGNKKAFSFTRLEGDSK